MERRQSLLDRRSERRESTVLQEEETTVLVCFFFLLVSGVKHNPSVKSHIILMKPAKQAVGSTGILSS